MGCNTNSPADETYACLKIKGIFRIFSVAVVYCLAFLMIAIAAPPIAKAAKLVWKPLDDPRIQGYRIYYGLQYREEAGYDGCHFPGYTGKFVVEIPDPDVDQLSISPKYFKLSPGQTYFFIIRSYGEGGLECCDSFEVYFYVPRRNLQPMIQLLLLE